MEAIHKYRAIKDLKDMLQQSTDIHGDNIAFKLKTDEEGVYRNVTTRVYKEEVDALGTMLIELGLKGKRIAIIGENRYEWAVAYLAVANGTGIVVPLDKSLPEVEIESLIKRSEADCIIYTEHYDDIMKKVKEKGDNKLTTYISMDLEKEEKGVLSQKELITKGKKLIEKGNTSFINTIIDADSMSFMLFTSGTTAAAKAVMLSHKNICANIMSIAGVIELTTDDIILSFLPLHHTFECTVGFLYPIYAGTTIVYCEGIRHIADNIKEHQVTVMISVPILFENMYKKVMTGIAKQGKTETVKKGIKITRFLLKFGIDIRKKVFKDIHNILGGKVRLFVSGAAGLDREVEKGFNELGFKVVQGYGLTETSPVICAGNDKYSKFGTVGKTLPNVEVKIEDKNRQGVGEIYAKGPNVMLGYYMNEESTNEVLQDGWFKTGDLGYIDKDNYLYVVGRKKNVIVLKNGKNIFPEELETLVNKIAGVKESIVYGKLEKSDDYKICAKIVYDKENIKEIYNTENEEELTKIFTAKIKEINKTMPPYKYIREVKITEEELIKTTTQKVKRHEEIARIENEG